MRKVKQLLTLQRLAALANAIRAKIARKPIPSIGRTALDVLIVATASKAKDAAVVAELELPAKK